MEAVGVGVVNIFDDLKKDPMVRKRHRTKMTTTKKTTTQERRCLSCKTNLKEIAMKLMTVRLVLCQSQMRAKSLFRMWQEVFQLEKLGASSRACLERTLS